MPSQFLEKIHIVHCQPSGISANPADYFHGSTTSDIISMKNAETCVFFIVTTANATGDAVVTIQACDDTSGTNTSNITFNVLEVYAASTSGGDTHSTISTNIAAYTTTTAVNRIYAFEVDRGALMASGYEFVRILNTANTDANVGGQVFAILTNLRYTPLTATQLT